MLQGVGGSFSSFKGHIWGARLLGLILESHSKESLEVSSGGHSGPLGFFFKDQCGKIQGLLRSYYGVTLSHIQRV